MASTKRRSTFLPFEGAGLEEGASAYTAPNSFSLLKTGSFAFNALSRSALKEALIFSMIASCSFLSAYPSLFRNSSNLRIGSFSAQSSNKISGT